MSSSQFWPAQRTKLSVKVNAARLKVNVHGHMQSAACTPQIKKHVLARSSGLHRAQRSVSRSRSMRPESRSMSTAICRVKRGHVKDACGLGQLSVKDNVMDVCGLGQLSTNVM